MYIYICICGKGYAKDIFKVTNLENKHANKYFWLNEYSCETSVSIFA